MEEIRKSYSKLNLKGLCSKFNLPVGKPLFQESSSYLCGFTIMPYLAALYHTSKYFLTGDDSNAKVFFT